MVLLAIPTYNRGFLAPNRGFFKYLPYINTKYITPVIFLKDCQEERLAYAQLSAYKKVYFIYNSIAEKRLQILDYAKANNFTKVIFADDDICFFIRKPDLIHTRKLTKDNVTELNDFFNVVVGTCNEEYPLTGLPLRLGFFKRKAMFEKNTKLIRFWCLHLPTIMSLLTLEHRQSICDTWVKEDYYIALLLLSNGYKSLSYNKFCVEDPGFNAKGGCSSYRNTELVNKTSTVLYNCFKSTGNIKLVSKVTKNRNFSSRRMTEVVVKWKAFLPKDEPIFIPKEEILNKIEYKDLIRV
jgi:hypothetical protein